MGCLIETKMTFIPQGHTSLSRKQKKVTYGAKVHTASLCCFAVRRAIATHTCDAALAIISPPIRSGPSQASPDLCPCDPRRSPGVKQAVPMDKNLNHWSSYVEKKGQQTPGYKQTIPGRAPFGALLLAEFGADAALSFADHITGVRGTGVRPRRCGRRSGAEGRQRGH